MKNFKLLCVLMLSIALLVTMIPVNTIAVDEPTSQQRQEQKKTEPDSTGTSKATERSEETKNSESTDSTEGTTAGKGGEEKDKTEPAGTDKATEKATEKEKDKEKDEYPAQTLTSNAGGVKVTLKAPEGALPEGSKLNARQVGQRYIDAVADTLEEQGRELTDAVAIDVTPVNKSGEEIQPKKSVKVTFSGTGLDVEAGGSVDVFRVSDDASSVTDMGGSGSANSQTFSTSHFTIYVAGGSSSDPTGQSTGNRYELEFGESVTLTTTHQTSSADYWSVSAGSQYITQGAKTDRNFTVINNNTTSNNQQATVRWSRNRYGQTTNEYFYLTLLPKSTTYNVTFDPKGGKIDGSTDPKTEEVEEGTEITIIPAATDRDNYSFDCWKLGNNEYDPGDKYTVNGDVTFEAQWTADEYNITYNYAGGTAPSTANPTKYTVEDRVRISNEPTREGYTFTGWTGSGITTPQKTISWSAGGESGNKSYTAHWEATEYSITYDYDGGDPPSTSYPAKYTIEDDISISGEPTKRGYTFTGWTGSGITTPQKTISWSTGDETGDKSYTANWEAIEYTISYDLAGGTVPSTANPEEYTVDDDVSIVNEPTREGYTFTGWTGSGITTPQKTISWSAGDESGNKSYKANWKVIDYLITYDYYGGTEPSTPNPDGYTYEENVTIENEPTKKGYTFEGWTGGGITTPQKTISWSAEEETGDKSYRANWKIIEYNITYDFDGGIGPSTANPDNYTVEDNISISNEPTKEGYTFKGWTGTDIDDPVKNISWSAREETGDKSYKAKWELAEYTISYDLDGGDAPSTDNPDRYTYLDDVDIENEPTREGFTFEGWTGSGIDVPVKNISWSAGEETGNKSYKASWKAIEYTITYNYAGGEGPATANPDKYTAEDDISISNEPTRDGYRFIGWTSYDTHPRITDPKKPVEWSAGDEIGDKTFTAWWQKEYTLTYHKNAGDDQATIDPPEETITVGAGDKITLATAIYEGHHFDEWNTKEDGTGSHHEGGSEFTMPMHDVELWAQWSEHPIKVTYYYNYQGASEPYREVSAPINDDYYQVISDKPTRNEYLFAGWSETQGATELSQIDYLPGANMATQEENINLYAVWVMKQNEAREYTQILEGIGKEVYYTGEEQIVDPRSITASVGGQAYIGVTSVDNPRSSSGGDYKYAGYVRVGDKTDGDPSWHHLYAYVEVDNSTQIRGTDVGVYNGSSVAPLYAHEQNTGLEGMDRLTATDSAGNTGPEYVEIEKNQLIIKPVPIVITTDSARKPHDGTALTAGGKVIIGADDDDQVEKKEYDLDYKDENVINLRNGEKVVIEINGSQTDVGSSKNNVVVHWSDGRSTGSQHNYTVSKNLGTLTVYDFTAEFYKNTEDHVSGMPEDWEGDAPSRQYTLPNNKPTRAHSEFEGWTTNSDGTGTVYKPGDKYTYPDGETDVKFYAKWSAEVDVVTYDPNGGKFNGTTRPTDVPCSYDEEHAIREAATRNHYDFVEWNTEKDGTGTGYDPDEPYTVKGDITFFAQWTPKDYSITYDYDGGNAPAETNPDKYTVEDDVAIQNEPTKEDYTFEGWTGSGIDEPQKTITWSAGDESGNKSYKANWKAIEYSIAYDYDEGEAPSTENPEKYTVEDDITIDKEPTKEGYTFEGWTGSGIDEPEKTITWSAGDTRGDKSYEANWKVIEYTIDYDYDGGDAPAETNPEKYTIEDTVSITNEPTRRGYVFEGWTGSGIDEPVTTINWSAGEKTEDKSYKANWKVIEYSITYDYNGGDAPSTDNPKKYTVEDVVIIDKEPTREGYDFDGWTGPDIEDPVKVIEWMKGEETGDKSYKANWTPKDIEITYDANGGKVEGEGSIKETHKYNDNIKITEAATSEDGLIFKGWEEVDGDIYQPGETYTVKKATRFVTKWKMPITFDPNGGKLDGKTSPTVKEYDPGSDFPIANKATREHYIFKGWNTRQDGRGDMFQPGDQYESSVAMTFYAIWEEMPKVIYVPNGGVFRGKTDPTTLWYDYDEEITIAEEPTREGYTFLYWKGSEYHPGDSYKVVDPVHLFVAQWEKNDDPDQPEKKVKDTKKKKKKKTPETGDRVMPGTLAAAMILAAALATLIWRRRREE